MPNKTKKSNTKARKTTTKIVTRQIRRQATAVRAKKTNKRTTAVLKKVARPVTVAMNKAEKPTAVATKRIMKTMVKAPAKTLSNFGPAAKTKVRSAHPVRVTRDAAAAAAAHRQAVRLARAPQFTYMNAPGLEDAFDVGNMVEVFCDHEESSERVRGWMKGTVVQVDNKLVAVQFRSNVFLTDGWMVPDRILWYSLTSDQIRSANAGKKVTKKVIPDY